MRSLCRLGVEILVDNVHQEIKCSCLAPATWFDHPGAARAPVNSWPINLENCQLRLGKKLCCLFEGACEPGIALNVLCRGNGVKALRKIFESRRVREAR
jgi:hypothetical protein